MKMVEALFSRSQLPEGWSYYLAKAESTRDDREAAAITAMLKFHSEGYEARASALIASLICLDQAAEAYKGGDDQAARVALQHCHWNCKALSEALDEGPDYVPIYAGKKKRASAGGHGRQKTFAPLIGAFEELLIERRPEGGWPSKAAAVRALLEEMQKLDVDEHLSSENLEQTLTNWLRRKALAQTFKDTSKP
ncbi:hypothetical protein [Luteimonas changyuni]|uniref:hypothetical protein n=1 Tax=Luteimonas sp. MJ145 TaxID=3129234 RepID=UPI0031BA54E3